MLIAGNWKMFKGPVETREFLAAFEPPDGVDVIVCPPFASLAAAVWSEIGKLEREQRAGPVDMDWKATGTGVIVEQRVRVGADAQGEGGEVRKSAFAMGAEPQILAGEKRGPLGTGSEPIGQKFARVGEEVLGMPVDKAAQKAGGAVQDMDVDVDVK